MPSYAFPPPLPTMEPTPIADLDRIVGALAAKKADWIKVPIDERIALIGQLKDRLEAIAPEWADAGGRMKGLPAEAGEEWLTGPGICMRNLRLLEKSLREIAREGRPVPGKVSTRPDGRVVVQVVPVDTIDSLLYGGITAEVWMQPGVTSDTLRDTMAVHYKNPDPAGKLGVVLGAGNMGAIPLMDVLYKLFVENEVVVLKMNPVNEFMGPLLRRVFEPLVQRGFLEIVYGGADQGRHLVQHPQVDTLHMTGSDATHDAIVWGPVEGRDGRKAANQPINTKPMSSELGNVTPILVVPGQWTDAQVRYHAENIATTVANNASFNCSAGKLLVTSKDWPQREQFLAAVREVLAGVPNRKAYYPGARQRWQAFRDAHPDAVALSKDEADSVPWTFIGGLDPARDGEICFQKEPFCGILAEVALPGKDAAEFLGNAVPFCNDKVWGTLAASVIVDDTTRKDAKSEAALQKALDDLRYGSIGVNHWAGVMFGMGVTPWGAYPGHSAQDIQSGTGVVHNTLMFDKPQKAVLYGTFTMFPKPPWFVTHSRGQQVGKRMVKMEARPSLFKVPGIAIQALLG